MNAYAKAGVDVDIEAMASRIMYEASKATFANRKGKLGEVISAFDDFSGLKIFSIGGLPKNACASMGFDGAGTKVEIAQRIDTYATIAFDLFAMLADDAVIRGGEPALIGSVLDIKSLGTDETHLPKIRQMADGYVAAAREANVAVINGEIAQMGALISGYGSFPFNWSGSCVWFGKRNRLISGKEVRPGQAVILFRERGFRSNGLSLMRKVFEKQVGPNWHSEPFGSLGNSTFGAHALLRSTIYSRFMVHLHGGYDGKRLCTITAAAHITGGGLPEKLGRMLRPSGYGVSLKHLFEPGHIVSACQSLGGISDYDAYRTWNMGQGMAVVTSQPDLVLEEAQKFGIEAKIGGVITSQKAIKLVSRGTQSPGKTLRF